MNLGYYPDQIIEMIKLPDNIAKSPYLYEFYGTTRWSVKSIFNGYLGWFNGNPSELDPLSREEKAKRISELAGGNEILLEQLYKAVKDEDMQWALELSDYLITLDFFNEEVKNLRQQALIYEGSRSSNPNKRNYFLTSALELQKEFNGFPIIARNEELLDQISINTFFDVLSVRFNPEKHNNDIFKVCFIFSSGVIKNITLRNNVAVISNSYEMNCNILIKTNEIELKKILTGISNPVAAIAAGNIIIEEGGTINFLEFLTKFQ